MARMAVDGWTEELLRHLAASTSFEKVSIEVEGRKLLLEGCVESYALKQAAEARAREAGFVEIENCLRVYPCEQKDSIHQA